MKYCIDIFSMLGSIGIQGLDMEKVEKNIFDCFSTGNVIVLHIGNEKMMKQLLGKLITSVVVWLSKRDARFVPSYTFI